MDFDCRSTKPLGCCWLRFAASGFIIGFTSVCFLEGVAAWLAVDGLLVEDFSDFTDTEDAFAEILDLKMLGSAINELSLEEVTNVLDDNEGIDETVERLADPVDCFT